MEGHTHVISTELSDVGLIDQGEGGRECTSYMPDLKESACSRQLDT